MVPPVVGIDGDDGEDAFPADAESDVPDVGQLREVLLGSGDVFQVVEVQDDEGVVSLDLIFFADAGHSGLYLAGYASSRKEIPFEAGTFGLVGGLPDLADFIGVLQSEFQEGGEREDLNLGGFFLVGLAAELQRELSFARRGCTVEDAYRRLTYGPFVGPDFGQICHNILF